MSSSSKPSEPSLLARLTGRRAATRRAPEPADLGTAFGMEAWLDGLGSNAHAATSTVPVKPAAGGWRARWLPRGGSR